MGVSQLLGEKRHKVQSQPPKSQMQHCQQPVVQPKLQLCSQTDPGSHPNVQEPHEFYEQFQQILAQLQQQHQAELIQQQQQQHQLSRKSSLLGKLSADLQEVKQLLQAPRRIESAESVGFNTVAASSADEFHATSKFQPKFSNAIDLS